MTGHNDSVLVQRLAVVNTGRRRRWSRDEKLRIVAESYEGHRQVSAVARRYDLSGSQLYAWRRALGGGCHDGEVGAGFSRVVLVPEVSPGTPVREGVERMEVVTAAGHRIIVGADVDGDAFRRRGSARAIGVPSRLPRSPWP